MGIAIFTTILTIVFVGLGIKFTYSENKRNAQIVSFLLAGLSAMFSVFSYVNSIQKPEPETEPESTSAITVTEEEIGNTSFETAKVINIDTNQELAFYDSDNKLYYCFTLPEQTLFSIQIQHDIVDKESAFCEYSLYYESNTEEPFYNSNVNYGNAQSVSQKLRKPEGKYFLEFEPNYNLDEQCKELTFIIIKESSSSTTMEIEPNNDVENATIIDTDTIISGNSESTQDIDYYKFTLDNSYKVNITFDHQLYDEDSEYWSITLFSQDTNNSIFDESIKSNSSSYTTTTVNLSQNKTTAYFIKVTPNYNSPSDEYTIKVNTEELPSSPDTKTKLAESEPNDDVKNATPIKMNKRIEGNTQSYSDTDYYKFHVSNEGKINVVFEHEFYDSDEEYWEINLISENGDLDFNQVNVKLNEKKVTSDTVRLSPGVYYVKVEPTYHYSDETYYIKIKNS